MSGSRREWRDSNNLPPGCALKSPHVVRHAQAVLTAYDQEAIGLRRAHMNIDLLHGSSVLTYLHMNRCVAKAWCHYRQLDPCLRGRIRENLKRADEDKPCMGQTW